MPITTMHLNSREKNLAAAFAGIVFLLLNLLFLPKLHSGNNEAKKKHEDLQAQRIAAQAWINQSDYWGVRKKWLLDEEPELVDVGSVSATQLERLQDLVREVGLEIRDVSLLNLDEQPFFYPIGARLTVTGSWPSLVSFLDRLQAPTDFDVITRISVRSDQEPPNVICEMEIQRWFRKPTPQ